MAEAQEPCLEASLLGETRIRVAGREIAAGDWPSRSARSLVLLLLVATGRTLTRLKIIDELWPHLDETAGRNALSKALHAARTVLEPGRSQRETGVYLVADRERIGWAPGVRIATDAEAFERSVNDARAAPPAVRQSALREALTLYHGDLLEAEPDADWAEGRRATLRRLRRQAVLDLAGLDRERGEPIAPLPALDQLLTGDPTDEEVHQAIIRAFLAAGQRERALRHYQRCVEILKNELDVAPSAETEALGAAILAERAPARPFLQAHTRRYVPPAPPTPLVGRERDLEEIERRLLERDVRLVTVTGTGGVGKTRLAQEVAIRLEPDFPAGACLVELAAVRQAELVLPAIARALGVAETGQRPLVETLGDALADQEILLVLDNCEQVLASVTDVTDLLAVSRGVKVLATSRELLHVRPEHAYPLSPLATPDAEQRVNLAVLSRVEAVALFLARAGAVSPGFGLTPENAPTISEICARLDGLPLAIELAAAQIRHRTPAELLTGLTQRLTGLTGGFRDLPPRHQTMRDAIAWSYDLLDPAGQTLFRRLSVFVGNFTLDAADVVRRGGEPAQRAPRRRGVQTQLLASLVDKSLVQGTSDGFVMLETIREFGLERLAEAGEESRIRIAHARWYAELATTAAAELYGADQVVWLDRLDVARGNLNAALAWSIERGDVALAQRLGMSLWRFWLAKSAFGEGHAWIQRILALAPEGATPERAELRYAAGSLLNRMGDYDGAREAHDAALEIWRGRDDRRGEVRALTALAALVRREGDYEGAVRMLDDALALARADGYEPGAASALNHLGLIATLQGRHDEAEQRFGESLALHRVLGDRYAESIVLNNLGEIANERGDLAAAAGYYETSLRIVREIDSRDGVAAELANLADVRLRLGEVEAARTLATEAVALLRALGSVDYLPQALGILGEALRMAGDFVHARRSFQEALGLNRRLNDHAQIAACFEALAEVDVAAGAPERAAGLLGAAATLRAASQLPMPADEALRLERTSDGVRSALGPDRFAVLWRAGGEVSLDQAVTAALTEE